MEQVLSLFEGWRVCQKINGSMYCEGPAVFGGQLEFPTPYATVCIGGYSNSDDSPLKVQELFLVFLFPGGINNPYSLAVSGNTALTW